MSPLAWATLVLLIGIALAALEVFVPSGGMLGFLSLVTVLAAIALAFRASPRTGLLFVAVTAVAVPAVLVIALQVWPNTPIGRRVMLQGPSAEEVRPRDDRSALRMLVGHVGKAKSTMLPSGVVMLGNQTYDAVSEGLPIDSGQTIRVVGVSGNNLVVRLTDSDVETTRRDPTDPLSQPIEALGLDPFEEPLA